jgi:hypothetical protein
MGAELFEGLTLATERLGSVHCAADPRPNDGCSWLLYDEGNRVL